jgi:predicted acylesterase/phospholipase RssA
MPKRLAITIAGAVSLGSYEAGVLYEVLNALSRHNGSAQSENEKIYIDVITGASAGGMTAAIAAQRLLYDPDSLADTDKHMNAFYEAWVERISLWSLVKMKWKENISHSLFSSDLIESIGRQMLIDPLKKNGTKITKVHPAIELEMDANGEPARNPDGSLIPKPLWLGMALTNLDGLNYGYKIVQDPNDRFQYTRCVDQITSRLPGTPGNEVSLWTRLRDGAVASGAFPFAFRVQGIRREKDEYESPALEWPGPPEKPWLFTYTDGGVLQNQPIGMAKNLIDKLVQERLTGKNPDPSAHNDADSRLYLFVSPNSLKSGASVGFTPKNANFSRVLNELVRTYLRQAEFHDWIMAEEMNRQVNCLDIRAQQLADALIAKSLDAAALEKASRQLAILLSGNGAVFPAADADRLKEQYRAIYDRLKPEGALVSEAWLNSILTLEAAAQLQTRDQMNILAVMARGRYELAGAGLAAFVGFFSRKYRDHDYVVGRNKARQYLAGSEIKRILGMSIKNLDSSTVPDTSGITNLPLPPWKALLVGSPALAWMVGWRLIRSWRVLLTILALIALIVLGVVLRRH